MSRHPSRRIAARLGAVFVAASLAIGAAGCSGSDDAQLPDDVSIVTLPPPTAGASCTDPTGDISDSVQQVAGTLSEPAGIDITSAKADVSDTDLTITFDTNGTIAALQDPSFFVSQGVSGQESAFELRIGPASTPGGWAASLITWDTQDGGLRESDPKPLGVPITVDGGTLSFSVPLTELPKIVTLVWQFGATATLPPTPPATGSKTVLDDCNNMADQTGPGTTTETTEATGPSTTVLSAALGTSLPSNDGMTVTAHELQNPVTPTPSLATPPEDGYQLAVLQAEVCAGDKDVTIQPGNFRLLTTANELWGPWEVHEDAAQPPFPQPGALPAGQCRKGWITYEVPTDATITDVVFTPDTGANGTGTVLWSA